MVKLALLIYLISAISLVTALPVDLEERETGLGIIGNAFRTALPRAVSGATVSAINYNTAAEDVATVRAGATTAASALASRAAACPNTKFVLTGYSKGAMVVHSTTLSSAVQAKVVAVAVFGDPNKRFGSQAVPVNNKSCFFSFCNTGDIFCTGFGSIVPHLAYATDGSVTKAASQIAGCFNA